MYDRKELIELHPLFRRLSGQVVWLMFEEQGVGVEDIEAFMDIFGARMQETLATMAKALDPKSGCAYLLLEPANEQPACEDCDALAGRAVELDRGDITSWFPPFGLGCGLNARLLTEEEYENAGAPPVIDRSAEPPRPHLVCGDWIFSRPWADENRTSSG